MHRATLASFLALALLAVLGGGCGSRRTVVQSAPPPQTLSSGGGGGGAMAGGPVLYLGSDLYCQFGAVRLQVMGNGQFYVDGTFVGTLSQDGGFYNVDGVEIGRLYPNGRMQYAGTMQDAGIDGSAIVAPNGVIAQIDGGGYLSVTGSSVPPAPVIGLAPVTVRTFLFAFSMFAALLDTAQQMGY